MKNIYLGLISGTSADGVDACAVSFDDTNQPQQYGCLTLAYDSELRQKIFSVQQRDISLDEFGELDTQIGEHFAHTALQLIDSLSIERASIIAIGSHGQTVRHSPNSPHPFSLQLGNPSLIAERTELTTVANFRQRDIAAGGQGAPLVPVFHHAWLGHLDNTAVLNLGGIANLSIWHQGSTSHVEGFDCGPANTLLDAWCSRHLNENYDDNGQWARSGCINSSLLENLLNHEFFNLATPKSTHIDQFSLDWLDQIIAISNAKCASAENVAATLVELTAVSVVQALRLSSSTIKRLIACGGGCKNSFMLERIAEHLGTTPLERCDNYGIGADWVEAVAFAWLARQTLAHQEITTPTITGARHACVLGGIYYA